MKISRIIGLSLLCFLTSCSMLKFGKKDEVKSGAPSDRSPGGRSIPIGEIVFVNDKVGFVLVRSGRSLRLKEGAELEARQGATPTAILDYSPERKKGFMTADILRGTPNVGDNVFVREMALPDVTPQQELMKKRLDAMAQAKKNASKKDGRKWFIFKRK